MDYASLRDKNLLVSFKHEVFYCGVWREGEPAVMQPTKLPDITGATAVAVGSGFMVLLLNTGELMGCGSNVYGQLGSPGAMYLPSLTKLDLFGSGSELRVETVSCGAQHVALVCNDRRLYTMGCGTYGRLGLGHMRDVAEPTAVAFAGLRDRRVGVVSVACGERHSAVVLSDGQLFTFGDGSFGRLGLGHAEPASSPTALPQFGSGKLRAKSVSCGLAHTAAVTTNGELYTWGDGGDGRLGHRRERTEWTPRRVSGLESVIEVSAGARHTLALTSTGRMFAWGRADYGRLGLGEGVETGTPQQVDCDARLSAVFAGWAHSAAITDKDGTLLIWGDGGGGRLGLGDERCCWQPQRVTGLPGAVQSVCCSELGSFIVVQSIARISKRVKVLNEVGAEVEVDVEVDSDGNELHPRADGLLRAGDDDRPLRRGSMYLLKSSSLHKLAEAAAAGGKAAGDGDGADDGAGDADADSAKLTLTALHRAIFDSSADATVLPSREAVYRQMLENVRPVIFTARPPPKRHMMAKVSRQATLRELEKQLRGSGRGRFARRPSAKRRRPPRGKSPTWRRPVAHRPSTAPAGAPPKRPAGGAPAAAPSRRRDRTATAAAAAAAAEEQVRGHATGRAAVVEAAAAAGADRERRRSRTAATMSAGASREEALARHGLLAAGGKGRPRFQRPPSAARAKPPLRRGPSFGRAPRLPARRRGCDSPGPAAYHTELDSIADVTAPSPVIFGRAERKDTTPKPASGSVGPGTYDLPQPRPDSAASWSAERQGRERRPVVLPGPSAYSYEVGSLAAAALAPSSPRSTFGSRPEDAAVTAAAALPGPGEYGRAEAARVLPGGFMGRKFYPRSPRQLERLRTAPGPGQYRVSTAMLESARSIRFGSGDRFAKTATPAGSPQVAAPERAFARTSAGFTYALRGKTSPSHSFVPPPEEERLRNMEQAAKGRRWHEEHVAKRHRRRRPARQRHRTGSHAGRDGGRRMSDDDYSVDFFGGHS